MLFSGNVDDSRRLFVRRFRITVPIEVATDQKYEFGNPASDAGTRFPGDVFLLFLLMVVTATRTRSFKRRITPRMASIRTSFNVRGRYALL